MSKRTDTHGRIVDDLTHHNAGQVAEAIRRLMDARPALPGAAGGGGGRVKGSHADPTLALACKPDPVSREIGQLDQVLRRMSVDAQWLRAFTDRWLPHAPTDRDRREVERANEGSDPLCEHCTDHRRHGDAQPVHRTGTVNGNLPLPMGLCRWCYDRVRTDGRLPSGDRLERLRSFKADAVRA